MSRAKNTSKNTFFPHKNKTQHKEGKNVSLKVRVHVPNNVTIYSLFQRPYRTVYVQHVPILKLRFYGMHFPY